MLSSGTSTSRLLVVEDDDTIRETVYEAELEGFSVTPATNGQSAWDRLKREPFELTFSM